MDLGIGRAEARIDALAAQIKKVGKGEVHVFVYDPVISGYVEYPGHISDIQERLRHRLTKEDVGRLSSTGVSDKGEYRLRFISRGGMAIAAVLFTGGSEEEEKILQLATYLPFIYEQRISERILFNLHEPVDFSDKDLFYEKLSELVCRASGTDSGAYRNLLSDGELRCLFTWRFGELVPRDEYPKWDCTAGSYEFFQRCLSSGDAVVGRNLSREFPDFAQRPEQQDIVSFCATPVLVGAKVDGVLTVAQRHEYIFSDSEIEGFKSIANAVGVAISNFKNFHLARHEARQREKEASAAAAVEIAQSIRHEIIGSAGVIKSNCRLLEIYRERKNKFDETISTIKGEADLIDRAVQRMKEAMDFERNLEYISIEAIIDSAFGTLAHRLYEEGVEYYRQRNYNKLKLRPDCKEHLILPNLVRFILHNLILNSIDSFAVAKKRNREIHVEYENDEVNEISIIRYFDNGRGLELNAIVAKMQENSATDSKRMAILNGEHGNRARRELIYEGIFEERITTKVKGSGYGLFLARKMAEYHGGSIICFEPQDSKWAIGFRVNLSTSLLKLLEKNRRIVLTVPLDRRKKTEELIHAAQTKLDRHIDVAYPEDMRT
jgi:signal transduction histidine kinase